MAESALPCGSFESVALAKVRELRDAKLARRQRRQLWHEARLEARERAQGHEELARSLQQLSVTRVRYPSAEDVTAPPSPALLQPQLVTRPLHPLDDPDPLYPLRLCSEKYRVPQYPDVDKLTYSDFENDNSSPFDNIELKTINDMELLAEVLQSQELHPQSDPEPRNGYSGPHLPVCYAPPYRRSRSVGDIVSELDKEVQVEHERRAVERHMVDLPPELQQVCQRVTGMGFPLERVARVCLMVGDDDKKVIEVLLLVEELSELGFAEERVCAALGEHHFDRDRALDYLVS